MVYPPHQSRHCQSNEFCNSAGPRFLLVASLTILTLSRERILALPRNRQVVLDYLLNPPQDSLFLPEMFMRACERVKFREEDWRKLKGAVEKEMGVGMV